MKSDGVENSFSIAGFLTFCKILLSDQPNVWVKPIKFSLHLISIWQGLFSKLGH